MSQTVFVALTYSLLQLHLLHHGHQELNRRTLETTRRLLAVEHILGMLAAGDTPEILLQGYPWLEKGDIQACLVYARRMVGHERIEPLKIEAAA